MKITRREFGKRILVSGTALSSCFTFPGLLRSASPQGIVVMARSEKLKRRENDVIKAQAARYLDKALVQLTGKTNAAAAWKSLFLAHEKVGIKLSCLPGKPLSSSQGLVMAVVAGLLSAGVKGRNIYVWERTKRELENAGFNVGQAEINIIGTDNFYGGGYSDNIEFAGSVGTCFSRIMENVDALINIPVLKDHDIAGVSIGMKNFYGAIYNPNKFHGSNCNPFAAELSTHPFIKEKLRLIVCDASRVQVHNGPAFYPKYAVEYGGILVSRDPVALDYTGWQIIEQERKKLGLKSLKGENREPKYILTAARLKLGQAEPGKIRVVNI